MDSFLSRLAARALGHGRLLEPGLPARFSQPTALENLADDGTSVVTQGGEFPTGVGPEMGERGLSREDPAEFGRDARREAGADEDSESGSANSWLRWDDEKENAADTSAMSAARAGEPDQVRAQAGGPVKEMPSDVADAWDGAVSQGSGGTLLDSRWQAAGSQNFEQHSRAVEMPALGPESAKADSQSAEPARFAKTSVESGDAADGAVAADVTMDSRKAASGSLGNGGQQSVAKRHLDAVSRVAQPDAVGGMPGDDALGPIGKRPDSGESEGGRPHGRKLSRFLRWLPAVLRRTERDGLPPFASAERGGTTPSEQTDIAAQEQDDAEPGAPTENAGEEQRSIAPSERTSIGSSAQPGTVPREPTRTATAETPLRTVDRDDAVALPQRILPVEDQAATLDTELDEPVLSESVRVDPGGRARRAASPNTPSAASLAVRQWREGSDLEHREEPLADSTSRPDELGSTHVRPGDEVHVRSGGPADGGGSMEETLPGDWPVEFQWLTASPRSLSRSEATADLRGPVAAGTAPNVQRSIAPSVQSGTAPSVEASTAPSATAPTGPIVQRSTSPTAQTSTLPALHSSILPSVRASTPPSALGHTGPSVHASTSPSVQAPTLPTERRNIAPTVQLQPSAAPGAHASTAAIVQVSAAQAVQADAVASVPVGTAPRLRRGISPPVQTSTAPSAQTRATPSAQTRATPSALTRTPQVVRGRTSAIEPFVLRTQEDDRAVRPPKTPQPDKRSAPADLGGHDGGGAPERRLALAQHGGDRRSAASSNRSNGTGNNRGLLVALPKRAPAETPRQRSTASGQQMPDSAAQLLLAPALGWRGRQRGVGTKLNPMGPDGTQQSGDSTHPVSPGPGAESREHAHAAGSEATQRSGLQAGKPGQGAGATPSANAFRTLDALWRAPPRRVETAREETTIEVRIGRVESTPPAPLRAPEPGPAKPRLDLSTYLQTRSKGA